MLSSVFLPARGSESALLSAAPLLHVRSSLRDLQRLQTIPGIALGLLVLQRSVRPYQTLFLKGINNR